MRRLETREISKSYRGRKVVDDVSISVQQGEVVGLLGPNGAGKTTSFYIIVGLISPDSGRVVLDDTDITALAMFQRARRGISYLPQEASVFRKLTVESNLMAILETLPIRPRDRRERMDRLGHELRRRGLWVAPVDYPAVPQSRICFRACVTAMHTRADLDEALNILADTLVPALLQKQSA